MTDYISEPKKRREIEDLGLKVRRLFIPDDLAYFPIIDFMEKAMPQIDPDFHLVVDEDSSFSEGIHGETDPVKRFIRLPEFVYLNAVAGKGRDRFTCGHEVGHFFLMSIFGIKFFSYSGTKEPPRMNTSLHFPN
jgi:hypothetical protein